MNRATKSAAEKGIARRSDRAGAPATVSTSNGGSRVDAHRAHADVRHRRSWARIGRGGRLPRPRVGTTLAAGAGVLASLSPGLLPRTSGAQAILTGLLVAMALGVTGVVRFVLRRKGFDTDAQFAAYRGPLLALTVVLIVAAVAQAGHWQNGLRAAMGTPPIGPGYWVRCGVGAALLAGLGLGLARSVGRVLRRLGAARGVAVTVAAAVLGGAIVAPTVAEWRCGVYAAANATVDPTVTPPVASGRSGTAASAVSWTSLGSQGRRFVADGPDGPIRVYVGLESAPDLEARVALALAELERSGGFRRGNIVVTVPTGSGWIDADAAAGFTERFGDDVALVGLQYSFAPSWATFVFGREEATASARALFTAIERRLAGSARPPRLFVYGQSLGALGGSALFTDDADQDRRTCAALWAGPPAGDVHHGRATILANSSDPVVHWSPSLLWRAPDLDDVRVDAPIPAWLPVLSFVQTTADLLSALDAPTGHGHRYGTDQGTSMGDC
ncbi:alpha/beta-hydrolase family protein [Nocardia aurea]|uniref:Alpha/beta-hydrolase family protein n=1 Tax=Nocardia aurea TaxID=2144174 RepID=A0ABV3FZL2_9NOCA